MVDVKKIKDTVSKAKNKISSGKVPPHKHCRICQVAIPMNAEPRVCKDASCKEKFDKDERMQKQMKFWMFFFFALVALPFLAALFSQL